MLSVKIEDFRFQHDFRADPLSRQILDHIHPLDFRACLGRFVSRCFRYQWCQADYLIYLEVRAATFCFLNDYGFVLCAASKIILKR